MVEFSQRARVQIASDILPPARENAVGFVISLAEAVRFVMAKSDHEQERLEILVADESGKPERALKIDEIRALYAGAGFPPPLPFG